MRANVLVTETVRGLASFGRPQVAWLYCLVVQAGAVLVWWPGKVDQFGQSPPLTLFAVLIALATTLSYQSIRCGGEELLFTGQQSLREWLIATDVPIWKLGWGYLAGHIIQTIHWLLLSLPLVLIAWSIDGGHWSSLVIALGVTVLLASVYKIAGSCVYLAIGQYRDVAWYSLRALLLLGFVAVAVVFPTINFWKLANDLLLMSYTGRSPGALPGFVLFFGFCAVVLGVVCVILARRIRNGSRGKRS